jgi:hypothetical protein
VLPAAAEFREAKEAPVQAPAPKIAADAGKVAKPETLQTRPAAAASEASPKPASAPEVLAVPGRANTAGLAGRAAAELPKQAPLQVDQKQLGLNLAQADAPAQTPAAQAVNQRDAATQAVRERSSALTMAMTARTERKVGGRVLYRYPERWVDAGALSRSGTKVREIKRDSKEFAEMVKGEPALAGLPSDAPVLLNWKGELILILK